MSQAQYTVNTLVWFFSSVPGQSTLGTPVGFIWSVPGVSPLLGGKTPGTLQMNPTGVPKVDWPGTLEKNQTGVFAVHQAWDIQKEPNQCTCGVPGLGNLKWTQVKNPPGESGWRTMNVSKGYNCSAPGGHTVQEFQVY